MRAIVTSPERLRFFPTRLNYRIPSGEKGCGNRDGPCYNSHMTTEHFDKTLQACQKRHPFRSYMVRFVSGEHIDVDHPEALVIRAGVAVYLNSKGVPTLFDHESVSEVVGEVERRKR